MWFPFVALSCVCWGADNIVLDTNVRKAGGQGGVAPAAFMTFWTVCHLAGAALLFLSLPLARTAYPGPPAIVTGVFHFLFLLTLLWAYQRADSTVIGPLMQLSPLFTWGVAWLLRDEVLSSRHGLAMALMVTGAVALSYQRGFRLRWSFWVMLLHGLCYALYLTGMRTLTVDATFAQTVGVFCWTRLGVALALAACLCVSGFRAGASGVFRSSRRTFTIFLATEVVDLVAVLSMFWAIGKAPSGAIVNAASSSGLQITMLLFALGWGLFRKEYAQQVRQGLPRKAVSMALITAGVWLVV